MAEAAKTVEAAEKHYISIIEYNEFVVDKLAMLYISRYRFSVNYSLLQLDATSYKPMR